MHSLTDCIFAQSTPYGRSALAIHRISGFGVFNKILPFLISPKTSQIFKLEFQRRAKPVTCYLVFKDKEHETIDDVLVSFFQAPFSYTGDETLEISCHGNPLIVQNIQKFMRSLGIRDAHPGEFTQRAFLNGKLDLTQAEAIHELIHAETEHGLRLARGVNEGKITQTTLKLRQQLVDALAYMEAHIDFGTDEIGSYEPSTAVPAISALLDELHELHASYATGLKLREGLKIVLAGRPNAGKSTLFNLLLNSDRAIVTDIPGTTRDVLEERMNIRGRDFVLLDTAGLRDSTDQIERLGVQRSRESFRNADVLCALCDITSLTLKEIENFLNAELKNIMQELSPNHLPLIVLVLSKSDLFSTEISEQVQNIVLTPPLGTWACVTLNSESCKPLQDELVRLFDSVTVSNSGNKNAVLISSRQRDKVSGAIRFLEEAKIAMNNSDYPEKISSLLNFACQSLAEIVGEIHLDSIYESIFSRFCIGK